MKLTKEQIDRLPIVEIKGNPDELDRWGWYAWSIVDKPAILEESIYLSRDVEEITSCDCEIHLAADPNDPYYKATPPVHANCKCSIVGGQWKHNEDYCPICVVKAREYNKRKADRNKGRSKLRSATAKQSEESLMSGEIQFSIDQERGVLVGPGLIPDLLIPKRMRNNLVRLLWTKEAIELYRNKFMKEKLTDKITFNHEGVQVNGYINEIWIKEDAELDKSTILGYQDLPVGTLFLSVKIDDQAFIDEKVKNGFNSFSVETKLLYDLVEMNDLIDIDIDPLQSEIERTINNLQIFLKNESGNRI